jgi:peptidoglycan/LPS O-acetylase OafA/YrhL
MNFSPATRADTATLPEPVPKAFSLGYRPGLDGLRGLSILGVMAVHTGRVQLRAGFIGVDVFFVLSGFLITCLLIEEWDRFHSISLRRFYARRMLRLLPALAVMLAVITGYHWVTSPAATARQISVDALIAFFYSSNWAAAMRFHLPNLFGHAWSLSIEEQFYLLWPAVLIWLLRRASSRSSMLNWLLLGALLPVMLRLSLILAPIGVDYYRIIFGTDTRADALLLGCLAGLMLSSGLVPKTAWAQCLAKGSAWFGALGLLALTVYDRWDFELDLCLIYFLIPALAALVLWDIVVSETGVLNRFFSQRWLVYAGKISYGLYVWHYPIFVQTQSRRWSLPVELTVEIVATAAATVASYYLLELPLLRFKKKFAPARGPVLSAEDTLGRP